MDFGALYNCYHADMTRTPVLGEATEKHREIYGIVKEAQESAVAFAKAGVSCKEMDTIPRNIITNKCRINRKKVYLFINKILIHEISF